MDSLLDDCDLGFSMRQPILISTNTAWNIFNFRTGLIAGLQAAGYEVVAAAPPDEHVPRLEALGVRFVRLPMDNKGVNPLRDASLFLRYLRLMRREQPKAFLGYTIKPNVYGSLAAHLVGVPVINNVSGLGTAFIRENWLTAAASLLYRIAFNRSRLVFFQNGDDRDLFLQRRLVRESLTKLLPGSGVDLARFVPAPTGENRDSAAPVFTMIARLILDKGVIEYVEAARIVRAVYPDARFQLLGFLGVENQTAVTRDMVDAWASEGTIEYLGATDDVRPVIAASDCVVLPSYREGTPRTLLEAAAMGKPLITTNTPGCRNVVEHGVNGYLCEVRSGEDLARKILDFLALPQNARDTMGAQSRSLAERCFDEAIVVRAYLDTLSEILGPPPAAPN